MVVQMDQYIAFTFFAVATLAHLILGIVCNSEIKKIPGGYITTMIRLASSKGIIPKLTSISFVVLLISIAVLLAEV